MKVYIVKILVEDNSLNSCSCEVFTELEQAQAYARKEINDYVSDYNGEITDSYSHRLAMQAGDNYVTIEIVEKELDVKTGNKVPDIITAQVTDIDWDTEGYEDVSDELPKEMTIDIDLQDSLSETVGDAITDMTGYCHKGFKLKFINFDIFCK